MDLIKACVMKVAEGAPRVSVVIKVDYRPGLVDAIQGKVRAARSGCRTGSSTVGTANPGKGTAASCGTVTVAGSVGVATARAGGGAAPYG